MPSWTKNSSRKKSDSGAKKVLAVCGAILVLLALGAAFFFAQDHEREMAALDPVSLCPKSGPLSELVLLIDRTDRLSETQGEDLTRRIAAWAWSIPKYGALSIYEIDERGRSREPIVSVCNPGDGSDASSLTANPKLLRQQYERSFADPVRKMIDGMQFDDEAPTSPIMESVQSIAVQKFGASAISGQRHLILVSDLLQFTDGLSLYKRPPVFDDFWRSPYGRSLASSLNGVDVSIFMLNRSDASNRQTDALGEFWIKWLQEQGASIAEFGHISG